MDFGFAGKGPRVPVARIGIRTRICRTAGCVSGGHGVRPRLAILSAVAKHETAVIANQFLIGHWLLQLLSPAKPDHRFSHPERERKSRWAGSNIFAASDAG